MQTRSSVQSRKLGFHSFCVNIASVKESFYNYVHVLCYYFLTGVMKSGYWIWSSGPGPNPKYQVHHPTHEEASLK